MKEIWNIYWNILENLLLFIVKLLFSLNASVSNHLPTCSLFSYFCQQFISFNLVECVTCNNQFFGYNFCFRFPNPDNFQFSGFRVVLPHGFEFESTFIIDGKQTPDALVSFVQPPHGKVQESRR